MLIIPMVLGLAAEGARSGAAWLVPPAIVLAFLAHHAIVPWALRAREGKPPIPGYAARRIGWGAAYLGAASIAFASAVLAADTAARGTLLSIAAASAALAIVYAVASVLGHGRSLVPEIVGLAGVALNGPMVAAAAGPVVDRASVGIAALALAYFLSSVAYVRAYDNIRTRRVAAIGGCVLAHLAIAAGLVAAAGAGAFPRWWWIAFVPVIVRTVSGLARPAGNLRQLGLREAWVAASFTLLASAVLMRTGI